MTICWCSGYLAEVWSIFADIFNCDARTFISVSVCYLSRSNECRRSPPLVWRSTTQLERTIECLEKSKTKTKLHISTQKWAPWLEKEKHELKRTPGNDEGPDAIQNVEQHDSKCWTTLSVTIATLEDPLDVYTHVSRRKKPYTDELLT